MNNSVSIIGLGWLGEPLGLALHKRGFVVTGSTRTPEKQIRLTQAGLEVSIYELGKSIPPALLEAQALVINIPPGRGKPEQQEAYPQHLQKLCRVARQAEVKQVLLVSSTGVYAEQGTWTDEQGPLNQAKAHLIEAEAVIQNESWDWTILRLAGLVGGHRHPARFLAGKKDLNRGNAPVNLVHRADCLAIIQRLLTQPVSGEIFNVCADEHPKRSDFYPEQAMRLGLEAPTFREDARTEYKCISNDKLKNTLGYQFQYPDPRTFPIK